MAKHRFIKRATENAHGQFRGAAERAGKSTAEYAREKAHAPGRLGKEARLASTLMSFHHKGRAHSDRVKSRYGS
jgi:hypothetical protein